jgi:hypothetical protein
MSRDAGHADHMATAVAVRGPSRRTWIEAVVLVVLVGVAGFTLWYRTTYNVWPGRSASGRVHWCGRDYEYQGPPLTRQQALALGGVPLQAEGSYPPLALSPGALFAAFYPGAPRSPTCTTLVFLRTGPDAYKPYALEGGP